MTQSMTGFSSSIVEIAISKTEKLSLSLHLKSLNSRYFEVTCKLPYLLTNLEVAIQRVLKKKLERGHVYLTVKIQQDATQMVVVPALNTIEQYLKAIKKIQTTCKIKEEVSLSTLLQLPNILQVEETAFTTKTEEKILNVIADLADSLMLTRKTEGNVLALDIETCIKEVLKNIKLIKKNSGVALTHKKKELDSVLTQIQAFASTDSSIEKALLEQHKITLLSELEKIDINEELVRAAAHIDSIQNLIKDSSASKGKKLDFTLQELNREINTIASKCSHSLISSLTIDIKTDIEKAREQAQNIL